jgi:hypothetical protein
MKINLHRKIKAPKENIWELLADFSNIHRFHPLLKSSGFIEGSCLAEPGATRQCSMLDGSYLKERILEWEPGKYYKVEIYDTSMPVSHAETILGVAEMGTAESLVYMKIDLTPRFKILSPLLYVMFRFVAGPIILRGLEKEFGRTMKKA